MTSPLPLSLQERGSPRLARMGDGSGEILVSGGGSGAALPLFRLCIAAARLGVDVVLVERGDHFVVEHDVNV